MPTNVLMNSVINKLNNQSSKRSNLIFNSDQAIKKQKELSLLLKNFQLSKSSLIIVGTFLQNINIGIFTEEELLHLLSYNYDSIESSKVTNNIYNYDYNKPLYDLDNTLINAPFYLTSAIQKNFKDLQGINKNLSIEYFINYLISQI